MLAVAVGIYLPLELSVPIFIGGLIAYLVERRLGVSGDSPAGERAKRNGILFAAGLITGEALMGIFIAIPIVMSGRADVLALPASAAVRRIARSRGGRCARVLALPGGRADGAHDSARRRHRPGSASALGD